jgi:isoquinoline 1-oxidoreductase subunit beta
MGQGVLTSLPMILADEMDLELDAVVIEKVGADPAFNHPYFGTQVTGGSTSVRGLYEPLRRAGAEARLLLLEAAAMRLEVPRESLRTEAGAVIHEASGRRLPYGALANAAAALPRPEPAAIVLKTPDQFRYIGRERRRSEAPEKVTGKALFGIDVRLPGMLTAVVAHPPVFGATLKAVDARAALAMPGVRKVKPVPGGVAVIAEHFWAAHQARAALVLDWEPGPLAGLDSAAQALEYAALAASPGASAVDRGEVDAQLDAAPEGLLELELDVPYLAHATMEPLNATVHHAGDRAEVWTGTQMQGADRDRAAAVLGLPPQQVTLHNLLLGGGFGRRASPNGDFVVLAAQVARDEGVPIKTVWTREDDTRGGYYRPRARHRLAVRLGEDGLPQAWRQRIVVQSIMAGTPFADGVRDGVEGAAVEGASDMPYAIPHLRVECTLAPAGVPVLWWRSVGHTHTAFAVEHMLDIAARRAGRDPLEYRRALLAGTPKWLALLDLVAERAGWGTPLPEGRARGLAIHASFGSIVAQVAEVSIEQGRPRVHRVVAAADLGRVVNPRHARTQIESGIVFGLSAALHQRISFAGGRVQQSNFHDYPLLRQGEMPAVEVHLLDSEDPPGGAGEPGTPPIAPAVANALLALTGAPTTSLPFEAVG